MRIVPLLPLLTVAVTAILHAQRPAAAPEPTNPPARAFHDARSGITFQVPAGWDLNRKDREVSTFSLDARSSIKTTQLRCSRYHL